MNIRLVVAAIVMGLAGAVHPASAKSAEAPGVSPADLAKIDSMTDELFAKLRAGDIDAAVNDYFSGSRLAMAKPTAFKQMISQTRGTFEIYGPVAACQKVKSSDVGSFVHYRTYVCQHSDYLTSWQLAFFKTSQGWIGAQLHFTDQSSDP